MGKKTKKKQASPSACCIRRHTALKKVHLQDTTEYKRKRVHLNELTETKSSSRLTKKPLGNTKSQGGEAGPDTSGHKGQTAQTSALNSSYFERTSAQSLSEEA